MAQRVRNNILQKENLCFGVKNVVIGAPPATTKRSVLGEVGNDPPMSRALVTRKVEDCKVNVPLQKLKEDPLPAKNIKKKPTLRKSYSTSCLPKEIDVEDIDKDNGDLFLVPEYINDIYAYLRDLEAKYPIKEKYLEGQEVTGKMRAVLVDWLVDVQQQFHLLAETLYLTVAIIDRYLQEVHTITRKKLQLVGVGAMFVASKYEEMFTPEVGDFVYICDNSYTKEEILRMEMAILQTLKFNLSRPLPLHFLRRYSKAAHALPTHHAMAKYFLELCLVDYEMCHYAPSLISAAAMFLALWLFHPDKKGVWTVTLMHYTTYCFRDIEALVKKIATVVVKASTLKNQAVNKKYAHSKFFKISCRPELKASAFKKLAVS